MEWILVIPLTAIVLGIGSDTVKRVLNSQERRMEMRMQMQQGQNEEVRRQFEALRAEIASLRDTSTQFDISLSNTVDRLDQRLSRLETRSAGVTTTEEAQQVIGLR